MKGHWLQAEATDAVRRDKARDRDRDLLPSYGQPETGKALCKGGTVTMEFKDYCVP